MEIYLLKSAACMAIFLIFYKLLLERENMHVFKRFYLLLALGASLAIPGVVFTEYIVVEPVAIEEIQQPLVTDYVYTAVPETSESYVLDSEPILWTIYFLGFTFFGFKFVKNLLQIIGRIRKNPKQKSSRFIQVLIKESFPPHTFFKYIFLNKKKLESNEIPKEVLVHEETHARQKHSIDVLFIELLQVFFWFNPLVYVFKKAIKLNHEFLADQAVLEKEIDQTTYQNTLLSYLSPGSEKKYHSKMANAINYSSIKKRFTVMKTKTSKKAILIRSLLLFPLIAILLLGFTETQLIEVEKSQVFEKNNKGNFNDVTIIDLEIVNDEEIWLKGKRIKLEKLATELSKLTSKRSKENVLKIYIYAPQALHSDFLELLNKEIEKISPSSINVFSEKYIMRKSQFQDSIEITPSTMRLKTNKMILEPFVPNILININKKGELLIENELLPLEDLKSYISNEYGQLKTEQKKEEFHSTVFIDIDSPSDIVEHVDKVLTEFGNVNILPIEKESLNNSQDGATKEQIKEYNSLAKMYNEMLSKSKSIQIKMKDVNQLKHIYGLMSDKQKAAAEPFPDFPEPPPVPKKPDFPEAPEPPKFNKGENEVPQPPLPPLDKIEDKELHNELQQIREERPQIKYIQVGKNNPVTTIEDLDQKQIQNGVSGAVVINGKNYYFLREGGETKYYNRYGQLVNNQGSLINEKNEPIEFIEIEEVEENSKQKKNNGFLNVNNETLFYTTNEKGTTYYNRYGEKRTLKDSVRVSSQIEDKNRPRESYVQQINDFNNQNALFYFKGEQISYYKALDLVFRKRNLSLATVKPKNNVKPIVILDRNFKKYNYKELIKSHLR